MREIDAGLITECVRNACIKACNELPDDVLDSLRRARELEESPVGRDVIDQLMENAAIALDEQVPICQDTGVALVFLEMGQDAHVIGGGLYEAINEGVRRGYNEGYLRKSVVRHPIDRVNTRDNTPAVIHVEIVPGDGLRITVVPKGGGGENKSVAKVLTPADGLEGVKKFVVETVRNAGPDPCPPVIVGVGLGGTLEKAALLSKKAILRRLGEPSPNPIDAEIERDLLAAVNETGVGPSGLGGRVTALAVHVESHPCHIASLPVAITLQCHAARHREVDL
ncbi:MAG: fumarate hydratase [Armatimonadetes bacterium RBG_16_58_9]|nr:MAG: fumarate hydratase [Armatimonadetes bacterium RBG_16_58_9]